MDFQLNANLILNSTYSYGGTQVNSEKKKCVIQKYGYKSKTLRETIHDNQH